MAWKIFRSCHMWYFTCTYASSKYLLMKWQQNPLVRNIPAVIVMRLLCHGDGILRCRCCHMEHSASERHTFVSVRNEVGMASLGCCSGKMVIMVCSSVMIQHNSTGALERSFRKWQSRPLGGAIPSAAQAERGNLQYRIVSLALLNNTKNFYQFCFLFYKSTKFKITFTLQWQKTSIIFSGLSGLTWRWILHFISV